MTDLPSYKETFFVSGFAKFQFLEFPDCLKFKTSLGLQVIEDYLIGLISLYIYIKKKIKKKSYRIDLSSWLSPLEFTIFKGGYSDAEREKFYNDKLNVNTKLYQKMRF